MKKLGLTTIIIVLLFVGFFRWSQYQSAEIENINQKNAKIAIESYERNVDILSEIKELKEYNRRLNILINIRDDEIENYETDISGWIDKSVELQKELNAAQPKTPLLVDLIPGIKAGVVHLQCPNWQGSAFVVGPRILVTAGHCVENVIDFKLTTDDGHLLHATRAISSKKHDIAFIYIDDLTCQNNVVEHGCQKNAHEVVLKPLKLGSIAECQLGQRIITIGSGFGKVNFNSVTLGIISGLGRDYDKLGKDYHWSVAFQTDSPGFPGNSGCPVFTTDGIVRGILVGGFDSSLIICMPCDLFIDDIEEINRMFVRGKYYSEKETDVAEETWEY